MAHRRCTEWTYPILSPTWNMEKPSGFFPALAGPRQANRKAGPGETAWRGSNKPRPLCNRADKPTSIWSLFARESIEPLQEEKQMTIDLHGSMGASSGRVTEWESIDWTTIRATVRRLQMRIAKAIRETRHGQARALQWLLTHSYSAKLLAVKRVTENKGHNTPGVDGKVWRTDRQKLDAIQQLKRRGYRPQPLRRTYLIKKNGKLRPLSIPVILDRAQQALHTLALQPVAE